MSNKYCNVLVITRINVLIGLSITTAHYRFIIMIQYLASAVQLKKKYKKYFFFLRTKSVWKRFQSAWTPSRRWRRVSACWASCWRATARRAAPRATRSSLKWAQLSTLKLAAGTASRLCWRRSLLFNMCLFFSRIFTSAVRRWGPRCSD